MNIKRTLFWAGFLIVLALIVWGLAASMNKQPSSGPTGLGTPALVTAADHVRGPANAAVTLIEYSDFQCPACEAYYPLVSQIMADSSTTVRLVYRHFPLPQHPNALPSAYASEAASMQGKFWEMYDLLFQGHSDWTDLSDPTPVFVGYAQKLGLDVDKFKADMAGAAVKSAVESQLSEGQALGIYYTPTFFVNGKAIENPQSYEAFKAIIDAAAR